MPIVLESIQVGWPPSATFKFVRGDKAALKDLFLFLADKRLLTRGWGRRAGITDLDDLRGRVDDVRASLYTALTGVGPETAEWLERLRDACSKLIDYVNDAILEPGQPTRPDESEFAAAVDELREAFRLVAAHVKAVYRLPAAGKLEDRIRSEIGLRPAPSQ
jgi:hypothetical protein